MTTTADLFARVSPERPKSAHDILRKVAIAAVAPAVPHDKIEGSFEHFIDKVGEPVKGAIPHSDGEKTKHYAHVKATFGDHAIVGCNDCAKTWHVPFGIGSDDKVITGEPAEREEAYVAPGALDGGSATEGDSDDA